MNLSPPMRRLVLVAHVATSVAWIGAVAGFLALAVFGLEGQSAPTIEAAYVGMHLITWTVILPLALASVVTGLVSSLGTYWGLFKHYWVVVKLLVTAFSTAVLVIHVRTIDTLAHAAEGASPRPDLHSAQVTMTAAAAVAVIALTWITGLSIYKPQGLTPFGTPRSRARRATSPPK
jgi:hypothetical protein